MQDKAKWDSQKKSVGDGSDQDEKQPQGTVTRSLMLLVNTV